MNKEKAFAIYNIARIYSEENYPGEVSWASSINENTFRYLRSKRFLAEYCWVVYASNFKVSIIESVFNDLKEAFKDFDIKKLARTSSVNPALKIFNNERKARCFLSGSKHIAKEGFIPFKKRILMGGVDVLEELPGIGPITKFHLGKNIGVIDRAKPDIWLERVANVCGTTVDELVEELRIYSGESRHLIDVRIWRYCVDKGMPL